MIYQNTYSNFWSAYHSIHALPAVTDVNEICTFFWRTHIHKIPIRNRFLRRRKKNEKNNLALIDYTNHKLFWCDTDKKKVSSISLINERINSRTEKGGIVWSGQKNEARLELLSIQSSHCAHVRQQYSVINLLSSSIYPGQFRLTHLLENLFALFYSKFYYLTFRTETELKNKTNQLLSFTS